MSVLGILMVLFGGVVSVAAERPPDQSFTEFYGAPRLCRSHVQAPEGVELALGEGRAAGKPDKRASLVVTRRGVYDAVSGERVKPRAWLQSTRDEQVEVAVMTGLEEADYVGELRVFIDVSTPVADVMALRRHAVDIGFSRVQVAVRPPPVDPATLPEEGGTKRLWSRVDGLYGADRESALNETWDALITSCPNAEAGFVLLGTAPPELRCEMTRGVFVHELAKTCGEDTALSVVALSMVSEQSGRPASSHDVDVDGEVVAVGKRQRWGEVVDQVVASGSLNLQYR